MKKGRYYVATIKKTGRPTTAILAEVLPKIIREFSWPKSMRWGAASASASSLRWVRPLHSILCTFGSETVDIIDFEVEGIRAGDATYGHRFLNPDKIQARGFDSYVQKLERAHVVLDAARRKEIIRIEARNLAFAQGLELIEDGTLLDEVTGLVEWPVPLMGSFDASFLELPEPVIRTTIRNNQKCFVLRGKDGKLANKFILTANIIASDGGKAIIAGNERVVRARLADAKFFFEQDKKIPLLQRAKKLDHITFHEKLGTQGERVKRIAALAKEIAPLVGAKPAEAELAAQLAKADLVTEMVGEFPELQGFMGRVYARLEGQSENISAAIEEHYKPLGPSDAVPSNPVSIAVALADKLDMLMSFWAIDEKPTGSKDPYALRRAALGIIKTITENNLRIDTLKVLLAARHIRMKELAAFHEQILTELYIETYLNERKSQIIREKFSTVKNIDGYKKILDDYKKNNFYKKELVVSPDNLGEISKIILELWWHNHANDYVEEVRDLEKFFHDRLKVQLKEQGLRHDVIEAVLALPHQNDLLIIVRRVEALDAFLKTDHGKALQAGVTRALNILKIEEKKDKKAYDGKTAAKLVAPEEIALSKAIDAAEKAAAAALKKEDFMGAMGAIANLRAPIDTFFDKVMVNEEPHRENRLNLLARIRNATSQIADFSKLEG